MNEMYQTIHILFSLTSCLPNPVASPFASPVRVTGRATGYHSCPNATATMKCCFSPSWVYQLHLVACWMIASVAPVIPWPRTGTGGSPRYTLLDPTQTPKLSRCRALTVFFLSFPASQTSSGSCRDRVRPRAALDHL